MFTLFKKKACFLLVLIFLIQSCCICYITPLNNDYEYGSDSVFFQKPNVYSSQRVFGDLLLKYKINKKEKIVECTFLLRDEFVGRYMVTNISPKINFNFQLGTSITTGTLVLLNGYYPQPTSLEANFTYTSANSGEKQSFKGCIESWVYKI